MDEMELNRGRNGLKAADMDPEWLVPDILFSEPDANYTKANDLLVRVKRFALDVIRFYAAMPKDEVSRVFGVNSCGPVLPSGPIIEKHVVADRPPSSSPSGVLRLPRRTDPSIGWS